MCEGLAEETEKLYSEEQEEEEWAKKAWSSEEGRVGNCVKASPFSGNVIRRSILGISSMDFPSHHSYVPLMTPASVSLSSNAGFPVV